VRSVLTIVAVALVAILSTALVAPLFIDWSAHRAEIESRLSAMTGADIVLTGPITVRLLPTSYLEAGGGSISGRGEGAPRLSFDSARLELALVKLASGKIRFSDIELDKPIMTMSRGKDGALRLPTLPSAQAETAGFDRLLGFPPFVTAPSGHCHDHQKAGGDDVMAVTLPQLVKPFATDFLVDFLENIGHGTCPSTSSRSALCLRRT